ncbi:phosphoenolpyruvate--protein phosphotransferase [Agromyces endophyticus]|uniref:phosphoenolpyruvate--protein phosphotransferase n=1 Tax=Agromyces sp. H17E-10 TaxID=2932244 RepID=UPI001FD2D076|nr:phosphoenolpyruvate--protein phosphotransferase [Agromyces sp. H17E-10]UOQ91266.1 phosphoenolpyruvate--protein phosphotransferase [Agromyces sp. H17E-10]
MAAPQPEPDSVPSAIGRDAELARAESAAAAVAAELRRRAAGLDGAAHDVLEAQALILEDPAARAGVSERLDSGVTAERAVFEAFAAYRDLLAGMGGYVAGRASDLDDLAQRVIAVLRGVTAPGVPHPGHPFVLVAHDLAPADTATLDLDEVLAIVTVEGGPTSHTAILAREKALVAVVGAAAATWLVEGETVIVDADAGRVVREPDATAIAAVSERRARLAAEAAEPSAPGRLADGTPVPLYANLGDPAGAADAVALGAEGVGLFRTEFLFLDADDAPSRSEQQGAYEQLFTAFAGRPVTVRVLDAGADKPLAFLGVRHEENPALGVRGIRALRRAEPVLRDQLAALADAAARHPVDLRVMAPMVATAEEARYFAALVREAGLPSAGVMIEVPAAALTARHVLAAVDFASIGTNDLTQYTMAADRELAGAAELQDPWHPAVLRLVAEVGDAGAALGRPVGVCGEAAADPLLAVVLVGLGVTSLSMSASALAGVRAGLAKVTASDARRIARAASAAEDAATARAAAADEAAFVQD